MSTAEFIDYYDQMLGETFCSVECAEDFGSEYENLIKINYDNYDLSVHGMSCSQCDELLNNAENEWK